MSPETRTRLIGLVLLLSGLAWVVVSPDISKGVDMLLAFLAGALLGGGGALLVTGEVLWSPGNGWPWTPPAKWS